LSQFGGDSAACLTGVFSSVQSTINLASCFAFRKFYSGVKMKEKSDEPTLQGLSDQEVLEHLAEDGYNELPSAKRRTFLHILWEVMREPMFLLLISCGLLYLFLGDLHEALMLLGFVLVVIGITFYQEQKTERALEALRDLSSPRALVIRNGIQQRIAGREVVLDDIVLVSEGDRVPADAVLLSGRNLSVDESLLTGESVPVRKRSWDGVQQVDRPGGDDLPFVYSGTLVVKGQGVARVLSTGPRTEIGKIGRALQTLETKETNLQEQTGRIVKTFATIGLILCAIVVVVFGLTRGDWLEGFLAGIALAMATLPEEFPVVLTIFMALGAWRISRHHVLTRRMPAVEMLGAATVLCVDKTGTLTMNRMTVAGISTNQRFFRVEGENTRLPDDLHNIVEYSILASPADPFDPMEKAIQELGLHTLMDTEHIHHDWTLVHEYPLSEKLLAMSRVWRSPDEQEYIIAAKGAPEAVADLCHFSVAQVETLSTQINRMADEGLRVIGVARATFRSIDLPSVQHDFDFEFLGLLGLADPMRPGVPEAIQECYTAGIRVIMITGDYPGTARNIARQIGLNPIDQIITGPELDAMSDDELKKRIKTVCIFARAVPEQKLRIVTALKANDEVVAMTGDGVNDAPALKAAHIGIAMGGRGTDVARESAALVLLDDNFSSIVQAVRMGRRIFDNLKKAMSFIFSIHIPIAGMSLLPVLLKWPLAMLPIYIVLLELIIDPSCSIVFEMEADEANIMQRRPRKLSEPLFGSQMIRTGLLQGLGVLVVVFGVYAFMLLRGYGEEQARMLAFLNMVVADLVLVFTNRSWTRNIFQLMKVPNKSIWWIIGGALTFLTLTLTVPFLRTMLDFTVLPPWEYGLLAVTGVLIIAIAELAKPRK
jgi:P-type Ca2+ transporter type 2C